MSQLVLKVLINVKGGRHEHVVKDYKKLSGKLSINLGGFFISTKVV